MEAMPIIVQGVSSAKVWKFSVIDIIPTYDAHICFLTKLSLVDPELVSSFSL